MKFDSKARTFLLYVLLPLYLVMLGAFTYVSNVYRGKYELPEQRESDAFIEFAGKGYILAQVVHVGAEQIGPGALIDHELAEGLVRAYGALDKPLAVIEPGGEFRPESAGAAEATRLAGEGRFLVRGVSIGTQAEGVRLAAGAAFTAEAAERVESAAAAAGFDGEVTVATAEQAVTPAAVESQDFTAFIEAGYILEEPVTIHVDGDEVIKEKGTVLSREVLLGLMQMREARLRDEFVQVRGDGPVIGFQYTFVFIVLNFLILVTFLYGLLWKPIITVLDKRGERIDGDLTRARDHRKKAEELFEKYRAKMGQSREEGEEIIADSRNEGDKERERIIEEARAEAESMRERASLSIEAERKDLTRRLTAEVGEFSVQLAEKILAREMQRNDHDRMVDEFIASISEADEEENSG